MENVQHFLVIIIFPKLADPVQQTGQHTVKLKVISAKEIINNCRCPDNTLPFHVFEKVFHSVSEVLHVNSEVRADTEEFLNSSQQLRAG